MKLYSQKGMTLVELIVAVAFTAVVIAAACMVLYFGSHIFQSGTSNAASQQEATLAESYLQHYASTAFTLSPANDGTSDGIVFSFSGDTLNIRKQTVTGGTPTTAQVASIDGISKIELSVQDKVLNYTIVSADQSYKLQGGIVLNNFQSGNAEDLAPGSGSVLFLTLTPPKTGS